VVALSPEQKGLSKRGQISFFKLNINLSPFPKAQAAQSEWAPGKVVNNSVSVGQIGGDIFYNDTNVLPSASSRTSYEANVGLSNTMSRSNQPGTRLLYSNDPLYITSDHYETVSSIGKWK